MKILIVHNRYRSDQPSGENQAVDRQIELLRAAGHEAVSFERSSDEIERYDLREKLTLPGRVVWSERSRRDVARVVDREAPDIIHVHNTFPLVTQAVLAPCAQAAPTVVSLHNYRLACPQGQLLRNGRPCELCIGHIPWRGVLYGCYRESRLATAPLAVAIATQRMLNIWNRHASAFVALSAFSANKIIAAGLDASRLHVLPNFSPRPSRVREGPGEHFLFLGRLSDEKAPELLLDAWRSEFGKLFVVGDGPLRESVESLAARHGEAIRVLGQQAHDDAMALLADARALIVSSRIYESGPLIVGEAFARGVPVIAPAQGAFAEVVDDDATGRLFTAGDAAELAACIEPLCDDGTSLRMGSAAREAYEESFTPERYVERLLAIYESATAFRDRRLLDKRPARAPVLP